VGVELHRCRCCSTWDPLMGHYTLFFVTVGLRIMTLLLTILVTTRSTVYTPYIRTCRVTTLLARTHILLLLACALLHFWGLRTTFTVSLPTGYSAGMLAVDRATMAVLCWSLRSTLWSVHPRAERASRSTAFNVALTRRSIDGQRGYVF